MKKIFLISFLFSGMLSASSENSLDNGNTDKDGSGELASQPISADANIAVQENILDNGNTDKDSSGEFASRPISDGENGIDQQDGSDKYKYQLEDDATTTVDISLSDILDGISVGSAIGDYTGNADVEKLSKELETVRRENENLETNFDTYLGLMNMRKRLYVNLQEQKKECDKRHTEELQKKDDEYKKRISDIEEQKEQEIKKLTEDAGKKDITISDLNTRVKTLDSSKFELSEELKKERGAFAKYKKLVADKLSKVAALIEQKESLKKELKESKETIEKLKEEKDSLIDKESTTSFYLDEKTKEIESLEEKVSSLEGDKCRLEEEKEKLEKEIAELRVQERKTGLDAINAKDATITRLKEQLDAAEKNAEAYKASLEESDKILQDRKKKSDSDDRNLRKLREDNDSLKAQLALARTVGPAATTGSVQDFAADNCVYVSILTSFINIGQYKSFLGQCRTFGELFSKRELLVDTLYAITDEKLRRILAMAASTYYEKKGLDGTFIDFISNGAEKEEVLKGLQ